MAARAPVSIPVTTVVKTLTGKRPGVTGKGEQKIAKQYSRTKAKQTRAMGEDTVANGTAIHNDLEANDKNIIPFEIHNGEEARHCDLVNFHNQMRFLSTHGYATDIKVNGCIGGQMLHGLVDRLTYDKEKKVLRVVELKTHAGEEFVPGTLPNIMPRTVYSHKLQVQIYTMLFTNMIRDRATMKRAILGEGADDRQPLNPEVATKIDVDTRIPTGAILETQDSHVTALRKCKVKPTIVHVSQVAYKKARMNHDTTVATTEMTYPVLNKWVEKELEKLKADPSATKANQATSRYFAQRWRQKKAQEKKSKYGQQTSPPQ